MSDSSSFMLAMDVEQMRSDLSKSTVQSSTSDERPKHGYPLFIGGGREHSRVLKGGDGKKEVERVIALHSDKVENLIMVFSCLIL
uniref:Uncharacterized protein n=1 Tax=Steinernema glaseri TaxID=37863 RepID=A0A1I8AJ68_9BILA